MKEIYILYCSNAKLHLTIYSYLASNLFYFHAPVQNLLSVVGMHIANYHLVLIAVFSLF